MAEVVLALDQGSASSRVLAMDGKGKVLARAQFPLRTFYPKPGWAEHDPLELARTAERALDAVLSRLPRSAEIVGLGIACQRSTVVFWDAATGKPLGRAPSWMDGRAAGLIGPMAARQQEAHARTGLYLTPYYSAPKIRWTLDNVPAAARAAEAGTLRMGPVATWLLWRLTGGDVFAADPTLAQRMLLFNLRTLDWDPELLSWFSVPAAALPRVLPSAADWGSFERRGRRIPVRAVLGDQQAAALGLGAVEGGVGVLNYGTGAFFLLHTGADQHRVPGLLTSVAVGRGPGAATFFEEGTVHAAGTSFKWLKEDLRLLDDERRVDAACRRARTRVLALSAIGGLGAPRWDYSTFTAFAGLTSSARPDDLVRGVADGVAQLLADIVDAVRAAGLPVRELKAAGGLSRVDYLLQAQADLLQAPVTRVADAEATAFGAASLAAEAAGAPWAGALRGGRPERVFSPVLGAEEAGRRRQGWRVFVESQQKLSAELRRLGVL